MRIKRNLAISDSGFIFNPSNGDSFTVNPIGLAIIKMLKDDKSTDEIKNKILQEYQTDEPTISTDVRDFLVMLHKSGLTDVEILKSD